MTYSDVLHKVLLRLAPWFQAWHSLARDDNSFEVKIEIRKSACAIELAMPPLQKSEVLW